MYVTVYTTTLAYRFRVSNYIKYFKAEVKPRSKEETTEMTLGCGKAEYCTGQHYKRRASSFFFWLCIQC